MQLLICRFLMSTVILVFCLLAMLDVACGSQSPASEKVGTSTVSKNIPVQREPAEQTKGSNLSSYGYAFGVVCLGGFIVFAYSANARAKAKDFFSTRLGSMRAGVTRDLKLKQQLPLTGKHSVHVISWNSQEFLLACGEQGVTLISQRVEPKLMSPEEHDVVGDSTVKVKDQQI